MRYRPTKRQGQGRRGLTLLEVIIAMTVFMILLSALTSTILGAHLLRRTEQHRQLAESAIHSMGEDIRGTAIVSLQGSDPWAASIVSAFDGRTFDVNGLTPIEGAVSTGTIQIVTDETITDVEIGSDLGLPRDLDDDGSADNADAVDTAVLLPVVLRVDWRGPKGDRSIVRGFYVLGYQ